MKKKFSETEKWYLLSNKDQIILYLKYNEQKLDNLSTKKVLMLLNETKKAPIRNQKNTKRKGNSLYIYIYINRVYLGKTPQTGSGAVLRVLAHLLEKVGNIFGV